MLEDEHREICFLDDHNDPHGERRFKRNCIGDMRYLLDEEAERKRNQSLRTGGDE